MPSSYLNFLSLFKVGNGSLNKQEYKNEELGILLPLVSCTHGGEDRFIELDRFLTIEESIEDRPFDDNLLGESSLNLIKVAHTSFPAGGGIYLGLNSDNFGKIYRVDWDGKEDNGAVMIADTIFDFLAEVKIVPISRNLNFKKLYKNWGEEFWRLRK